MWFWKGSCSSGGQRSKEVKTTRKGKQHNVWHPIFTIKIQDFNNTFSSTSAAKTSDFMESMKMKVRRKTLKVRNEFLKHKWGVQPGEIEFQRVHRVRQTSKDGKRRPIIAHF